MSKPEDPVITARYSGAWYASAIYFDGRMVRSMEGMPTEEAARALIQRYLGDPKSARIITIDGVKLEA